MSAMVLYVLLFIAAVVYAVKQLWSADKMAAGCAVLLLGAGMAGRILCLDYPSHDYITFLAVWFNDFKNFGLSAFKTTSSDYNAPYLYLMYLLSRLPMNDLHLIKWLSVLSDLVLCFSAMELTRLFVPRKPAVHVAALGLFWLWPTFLLNSAYWGQCDSLYTALVLLALVTLLKERPGRSVIFIALAFSFKLQTIFFLPMYLIFLAAKRVKLKHALIFPAVLCGTMIPALLAGMPLRRALGVYAGQVSQYRGLNYNSPSVFAFLPDDVNRDIFFVLGLLAAGCFVLLLLLLGYKARGRVTDRQLVLLAAVMATGMPFLLPSMHDRYFYLAEALALCTALLIPRLTTWSAALLILLGSYGGYHAYLFRKYFLVPHTRMGASALLMLAGLVLLGWQLYLELREPAPEAAPLSEAWQESSSAPASAFAETEIEAEES